MHLAVALSMHLAGPTAKHASSVLTHHSTSSLSRRRKAGQNQRGGALRNAALRLASSSTPSGRCSSSPSRSSLAHVLHRRPGRSHVAADAPPRSHPAVPVAIPRGQREHRGRPQRAHLRVAPRGDARLRASGEYEPLLSIVPRARLPLAAPARRIPSRSRITWTRGDASCHRTTRTCLSS
jgi:hypothetical protein